MDFFYLNFEEFPPKFWWQSFESRLTYCFYSGRELTPREAHTDLSLPCTLKGQSLGPIYLLPPFVLRVSPPLLAFVFLAALAESVRVSWRALSALGFLRHLVGLLSVGLLDCQNLDNKKPPNLLGWRSIWSMVWGLRFGQGSELNCGRVVCLC